MNKLTTFTLIFGMLPSLGWSVEDEAIGSREIKMRPSEKRSLTLKKSERNPYAKRSIDEGLTDEDQNSEEISIRNRLQGLQVLGSSRGQRGMRLLLGDILVENGTVLPPLIPDQTQHLKVMEVTNNKVVLGWMDIETGDLTGKTLQISYDLEPSVQYILQGQKLSDNTGISRKLEMGVIKPKRYKPVPSYEDKDLTGQ